MRINFTFRNLEPSEGIKNYASEKIGKVQRYMQQPLDAEVTFSVERHLHCADVTVYGDGQRFAGHEESDDMYASIDKVMGKVDRQVRDAKAAQSDRRRHAPAASALGGNDE